MNLYQTTRVALDFTRRLQAALNLDDLELCQEILVLRGQAMKAFEICHRAAGPAEKAEAREAIQDLIQADEELQEQTGAGLAATARDFRENMVSSQQAQRCGYQNGPTQACIDRKA
jgi:hypothetical protein